MKATAPPKPGVKMTIRVYQVDRAGTVAEDRGTVHVQDQQGPPPLTHAYPPCACPRCRAGQAVAR